MRVLERKQLSEDQMIWYSRAELTSKQRETSWEYGVETQTIEQPGREGIKTITVPLPPGSPSPLMEALLTTPGVTAIDIYRYHVVVSKSPMYSWDEVSREVQRLLISFNLDIENTLKEESL